MARPTNGSAYAAVSAFLVIALAPVAWLAMLWMKGALTDGPHVLAWALPSERTLPLLGKSVLLATAVAVMATLLGVGLAIWLSGEGRGRKLVRVLYLLPFFVPPYVHVLAWMAVAGRRQALDQVLARILGEGQMAPSAYGFVPSALLLAGAMSPLVTLLVRSGLEAIEPELVDAGLLMKAPWPVVHGVVWPLVKPSVLAGAGLVFVLTLVEYAVPSMLEQGVYVMEVYASFSQDFDPVRAAALSAPLVLLAAAVLVLSQTGLRNSPLRGRIGSSIRLPAVPWPMPVRALALLGVGAWIIGSAMPVLVLLARGGRLAVMAAAIPPAGADIALTLAVATASAALVAVVAIPIAANLARARGAWKPAWLLCVLPLAVPAPVLGIGLITFWNRPSLAWGYDSALMLVVGHTARFLPFGVYAAASLMRRMDPALLEVALLPRVSRWRRFLWVNLPLSAPAVLVTMIVAFVLSLSELGASLLISPPGHATLPMRIYNLLHYGATDIVAALSLVVILLAAVACAAALAVPRRLWGGAT